MTAGSGSTTLRRLGLGFEFGHRLGQRFGFRFGFWLAATVICGAFTAETASAEPARYQPSAPSAEGIGKRYMGREIAHVMGFQGAAWLERSEREQEERTDLLLPLLKLKPGMAVADVGAGTGYIARRMATLVGPGGRVWAVDVQPDMIRMLEAMAEREGLAQVKPLLGAVDDVKLAPSSIDVAVMVDVYHELEFPYEVLASVVRALKPEGRVMFVEYRAEVADVPIKSLHKMSEVQVKREAAAQALVWDRTDELPW